MQDVAQLVEYLASNQGVRFESDILHFYRIFDIMKTFKELWNTAIDYRSFTYTVAVLLSVILGQMYFFPEWNGAVFEREWWIPTLIFGGLWTLYTSVRIFQRLK